MRYAVMVERIPDEEATPGFFHARIPSLGLTTHGFGIEGALDAARDLAALWVDEKRACGARIPVSQEAILASAEVA